MKCEQIMLDENTRLDTYISDKNGWYTRKAILVIPGGGYEAVSNDCEGEAVGQAFVPYGFNFFVLQYSVDRTHSYPYQLIQASMAMKFIRDHAEEYGIDPEEIYVVGFSAGAHLCGCLGIQWNKQEIYDALPMPVGYHKPKGILMIYPVVSGVSEYTHKGSFQNLFCSASPTKEQLEMASLELHVTKDAVPVYLVHGAADIYVPVENSLLLANAYSKAQVPFELHIYPKESHGFGLGNHITNQWADSDSPEGVRDWVKNAITWMKTL